MTDNDKSAPLQVGVVGCGMMATGTHLPSIARNPDLELRWLCDRDEQRLQMLSKQYDGVRTALDYHEVLDDPQVDFVVLATTHSLRAEFIEAAARREKPMYVEKPLASSPEELRRIMAAVRAAQVPFCVGHNRRSAPAVRQALALLEEHRKHPRLTEWRLDRNTHLRPHLPEEDQTMVLLRVNDDILSWKPWGFGDGIILGELTHFLDLANLFVGREPRRVFAMGSARTNATVLVEYDDGSVATVAQTGSGTLDYPKELYEITHKGVMIAVDHLLEIRASGLAREQIRYTFPPADASLNLSPGIAGFYEAVEMTIAERLRTGNKELFLGSPNKGHYEHLDQFARCVRGRAESPCSLEEGAKATVLTFKAVQSCRMGLPLSVSPEEYQLLYLE